MPAKKSPKAPNISKKEDLKDSPITPYDSIGAAAAAERVPVPVLRKAKRAGAPGFKGSRVYFGPELRAWLADNMDRVTGATEDQIKEEKLRALRWNNDLKDKLYVRRAEVEQWIAATTEKIKSILRKKLRNELPPKIEGLRAAEISAKMESEVIGPICRLLRFVEEDSKQEATEGTEKTRA